MLNAVEKLPPDPILGLTVAYNNDANPNKIDLGAGVYKDEMGITPVFDAVSRAEELWFRQEATKVYIPPPGFPDFNTAIALLTLGRDHPALRANRVGAVMAPGGCGALRVGAELINRCRAGARLWVSSPTWANHVPLLGTAGLKIQEYPYYDPENHEVMFDKMLDALGKATKNDVVLFHGCCHNPTGADLTNEQWQDVGKLAARRGFLPYIDLAYQGLGDGVEEDAYGVRLFAESLPELLVAYSCSKNFGLYRERTGALIMVGETPAVAEANVSHACNIARTMYSMPPAHGGAIVKTILQTPELQSLWKEEVDRMRIRINSLRALLADTLHNKGARGNYEYVRNQRGMFSFLGIRKDQVRRLREEFSIYLVDSSRINIAGVSPRNIEYLTTSIVAVL